MLGFGACAYSVALLNNSIHLFSSFITYSLRAKCFKFLNQNILLNRYTHTHTHTYIYIYNIMDMLIVHKNSVYLFTVTHLFNK